MSANRVATATSININDGIGLTRSLHNIMKNFFSKQFFGQQPRNSSLLVEIAAAGKQ
jgi:hypothetical protein